MGRRLRALCGELDAPGRDEIGELDGKIEQLMRTIANPTAAGWEPAYASIFCALSPQRALIARRARPAARHDGAGAAGIVRSVILAVARSTGKKAGKTRG